MGSGILSIEKQQQQRLLVSVTHCVFISGHTFGWGPSNTGTGEKGLTFEIQSASCLAA